MVIDVHAHLAPTSFISSMHAHGHRFGVEVLGEAGQPPRLQIGDWTSGPMFPALCDQDDRLVYMDANGIDVQVLSPFIDLTAYEVDPAVAVPYSTELNEAMAESVARTPGRFAGLGTAPLHAGGERAAQVLRSAMTDLGLRGVEIPTRVPGRELDDPDLDPFWAAAEQLGAFILLHPHRSRDLRPDAQPFLDFVLGNPADTTLAVGQLMFGGVLTRFPGLKVCAVHGGGFLPWQLGRMDAGWYRAFPDSSEDLLPSRQLRGLYVDSIMHRTDSLNHLLKVMGSEHILLGTDYPYALGDLTPLDTLSPTDLAKEPHRTRICCHNAATLLDLEVPATEPAR